MSGRACSPMFHAAFTRLRHGEVEGAGGLRPSRKQSSSVREGGSGSEAGISTSKPSGKIAVARLMLKRPVAQGGAIELQLLEPPTAKR